MLRKEKPMSLDTYTTPEALKMLDYFGWPEGIGPTIITCGGEDGKPWQRFWCNFFNSTPSEKEKASKTLAILQAHCWKIIKDRYDYSHDDYAAKESITLCAKNGDDEILVHFCNIDDDFEIDETIDLDTLLENTCTWIMNRELNAVCGENENG